MSRYVLSTLLAVAGLSCQSTLAQPDPSVSVTPLVDKRYSYPDQILSLTLAIVLRASPRAHRWFSIRIRPYQVNLADAVRGPQQGYNQCNSTTEGPDSLCQTVMVNSIDCAPPKFLYHPHPHSNCWLTD